MSGIVRKMASSSAKRPAMAPVDPVKLTAAAQAKKRMALGNITNQACNARNSSRQQGMKPSNKTSAPSSFVAPKKIPSNHAHETGMHQKAVLTSSVAKPGNAVVSSSISITNDGVKPSIGGCLAPCRNITSPNHSEDSVSMNESMSTCDSMKSPDFEYIDNADSSVIASLERRATDNLRITEGVEVTGYMSKKEGPIVMDVAEVIVDLDADDDDPQLCAAFASDIYKHLRIAELKKRPSTDFMEKIQKDINASMRAILIDWLVEVAEEYRLVPDTLYLTVNYIDRYLSDNEMHRQKLQLLGVACMLIAAKYEEICAPQVEEFCYITDNTYFKDEVLEMEAAVLKFLKFEMTAPTAKCFLRRFVRAAQGCVEGSGVQLEFLANYVAELSLLEYGFLRFSPSMVAASSVFLANFIMQPTKRPWNPTLHHYTLYMPSEISECVKSLHRLFCNSPGSSLPAIREKYSQHKYKFVAKKYCPPFDTARLLPRPELADIRISNLF